MSESLILFLSFCFGAALGSFLNVVILRLPKEQRLTGRSACVFCRHILGPMDLIPILSFILLSGKCRYCRQKISSRYFIIEAATGLLFAFAYALFPPADLTGFLLLLKLFLVISVCVITFVVDLEHYIILADVIFPGAAAVLIINLISDIAAGRSIFSLSAFFLSGLSGAVLGSLPVYALWYASKWRAGQTGRWMGFGDVQLMLFLGAATGLRLVLLNLFLAILLGGAAAAVLLLLRKKTLKSRVPFGVFLTPAAIIVLFWGEKILAWYLPLLGF